MAFISRGPTLGEQVYSHVRERIISGDYQPGHIIIESELAQELNVSRTPVSNALIMLKERGLIEERNGKLAVPRLSLKDVIDLYQCRWAFDSLATRLAATLINNKDIRRLERNLQAWEKHSEDDDKQALWVADLEFHDIIYKVSNNQHLLRFAQIATELAAVYRRNTIRRLDDQAQAISNRSRSNVLEEHRHIFQALCDRDPEAAERAASTHMRNVIAHLESAEVIHADA